ERVRTCPDFLGRCRPVINVRIPVGRLSNPPDSLRFDSLIKTVRDMDPALRVSLRESREVRNGLLRVTIVVDRNFRTDDLDRRVFHPSIAAAKTKSDVAARGVEDGLRLSQSLPRRVDCPLTS